MDLLSDEIRAKKDEVEGLKKEIREAIKEEAKEKNDIENFKKDIVPEG